MERSVTRAIEGRHPRREARRPYHVLFLCTGNSARSIMAECAMNRWGAGNFLAFSAGSHPRGQVHPMALQLLGELHYPTEHLRSKSWDEFARAGSPPLDFVFTVCDKAAGEACPLWPGQPMTRIMIFASLRFDDLDTLVLPRRLDEIGRGAAG